MVATKPVALESDVLAHRSDLDDAATSAYRAALRAALDLRVVVARFLQNLARVLAGKRRAALDRRWGLRELDREAGRLHVAFGRMIVFDEGAVVLDLLVVDEIGIAIDRAAPDVGGAKQLQPFGDGLGLQPLARLGKNLVALGPGVGLVVHGQERGLADQLAECCSFGNAMMM